MNVMKKILSTVVRLGVSAALLFVLFRKVDLQNLSIMIRGADKGLLLVALGLNFFNVLFCFLRWKQLLKAAGVRAPLSRIITSFSGGIFFNLFLPSAMGGDVVRSIDLSGYTKKPRQIVATVFLDRLSGYIGLAIMLTFAVLVGGSIVRTKSVLLAVGVIIGVLVCIIFVVFNRVVYKKVNRFLDVPKAGRLREAIRNMHDELHGFSGQRKVMVTGIIYSLLVQMVGPLSAAVISMALGVKLSLVYFFIFVPIVGAITMLPISLGGLGVRDASMIFFFSQVGMSKDVAFAMSLLGFSVLILYGAIGGIVYVLTVHNRRLQPRSSPPLRASR